MFCRNISFSELKSIFFNNLLFLTCLPTFPEDHLLFLCDPHHQLPADCHIMAIQQLSMIHIHKTHYHLTVMADKSPQYRLSHPEITDPLISCLCHEDPPQSEPLVAGTISE
ncbi:hypothetical protein CDAR_114221 [Caerostris darwini]|uniref:Uncharacterized protein n=1 Tax=Caerostris darwini TaxID=1538125 RepID=A0AAV4MWF7_9ARAC|nr:hypothetical protein CDAR_229251 [Caerostris darwini]GIY45092.1 hypothetical protein CDAR_114221 [Caerostris darwini]